ncbi:MAG: SMC-Scp complex subunit ScpB [Anaerolineales bacterium]
MSEPENSLGSVAAQLEALLFVATEPASVGELAEALELDRGIVEAALRDLQDVLRTRGLRLQRHANRLQLTTAPELAANIERFLGLETRTHIGRSGLETLAIVAYNQPVTRPQIDAVRGVNSDSVLKNLLFKGLICELGRGQGPGRPILYGTTPEFLQHLGLESMDHLPPLQSAVEDTAHDALLKG